MKKNLLAVLGIATLCLIACSKKIEDSIPEEHKKSTYYWSNSEKKSLYYDYSVWTVKMKTPESAFNPTFIGIEGSNIKEAKHIGDSYYQVDLLTPSNVSIKNNLVQFVLPSVLTSLGSNSERLLLNGEILLKVKKDENIHDLLEKYSLSFIQNISDTTVLQVLSNKNTIDVANQIQETENQIEWCHPNFIAKIYQ